MNRLDMLAAAEMKWSRKLLNRHCPGTNGAMGAQWEIRALADEVLRLAKETAPALFAGAGPACVSGPCLEGKLGCGKASEMRERYRD